MRHWVLALVLLTAMPAYPRTNPTIKRLDGSAIAPAEVDTAVTRLMRAAKVTGVGIAILNGGRVVYQKAYGYRDRERNLPLTPDTVMTAASFTKSAFAYMAMQLVDEGILDLDKPIQQYLPKPLPEYDDYRDLAGDERYKKLTARMLLDHTTGFPNWRWLTDDQKLRFYFEPGARYGYSGEGISLLQLVVETVTKRPLQDLMNERIFKPFGMTRTSMVSEARFADDLANGYDEDENSLGAQNRKRADAAGSMQTTLRDVSRFLEAVAAGKGLSAKARETMFSPQVRITSKRQFPTPDTETTKENDAIRLSYGLGWGLYWTPRGKAFFKEGNDDGLRHYMVYFDEVGTGIVIMTNSANGEGIYKGLLESLLRNTYTPIEWEGFTPYDRVKH